MEYEACYTWKPDKSTGDIRPTKRRRTEHKGLQQSWPARKKLLDRLWSVQEKRLLVRPSCLNREHVLKLPDRIIADQRASDRRRQDLCNFELHRHAVQILNPRRSNHPRPQPDFPINLLRRAQELNRRCSRTESRPALGIAGFQSQVCPRSADRSRGA